MTVYPRLARLLATACLLTAAAAFAGPVRFTDVQYADDDGGPAPDAGQFRNPVLAGFYPDPSAVRVGDDFYLVTSTFGYFPGLPVFHSRDLVSWRQLGNAIDRPAQMPYGDGEELTRGLFAATISHHDGRFYIANTCFYCPGRGMGNFVVTATDPAGPWSDPAWLDVSGIDPSLFFDDDGRAWLVHNDVPQGTQRYAGHRAIWLRRFDPDTLSLTGDAVQLVDAGVHPETNPEHVEGPHLFKHDGWYYLTAAEGGTGEQHAQMIWRSRTVSGPYEAWSGNPTLTQRDLDPARPAPVTSTGHAQFLEAPDGTWWAVFLATRPYRGNQYNLGRETFLLPVTWQDGWPVILPRGERVPMVSDRPALPADAQPQPTTGPMAWTETFRSGTLPPQWLMLDPPTRAWFSTGADGLRLLPSATPLARHGKAEGHPSYLGHRLQHHRATFGVTVDAGTLDAGELAGLALLQNERHHLVAAIERDAQGGASLVVLQRAGEGDPANGQVLARILLTDVPAQVSFRFHLVAPRLDVDYAFAPGDWQPLATDLDASGLSVDTAGGFIGNTFGPYALKR